MTGLLAYGCSSHYLLEDDSGNVLGTPEMKYKVFSFLFDGVPSPYKEDAKTKTVKGAPKPKGQYIEHGPYAAKMCEGCHQRATNKLILPVEELCLNCHTFRTDKKKVHGPIASGGCRICHDPHGSPNNYILVSGATDFCFHCHDKNSVFSTATHKGIEEGCTTCHDAHMSDNEFLLK